MVAPFRNSHALLGGQAPYMLRPPRSPTTLRCCSSHSWGIFWFRDPVQLGESSQSWLYHPSPAAAGGMHVEGYAFLSDPPQGRVDVGWAVQSHAPSTVLPQERKRGRG